MLDFLRASRRRFVDVPVRLQRHELLSLTSAAGFDLQVDAHALWITTEAKASDTFLSPGERFRIDTHQRVVISADCPVTVTMSGEAGRATRFNVIRTNGERESAYPQPAPVNDAGAILSMAPGHSARCADLIQGALIVLWCGITATAFASEILIAPGRDSTNGAIESFVNNHPGAHS
jgi:hypothetical protein